MAEEYVTLTERVYSTDPDRPRYVVFYEGQTVPRNILAKYGYAAPAAKARKQNTVEDKAIKPESKTGE